MDPPKPLYRHLNGLGSLTSSRPFSLNNPFREQLLEAERRDDAMRVRLPAYDEWVNKNRALMSDDDDTGDYFGVVEAYGNSSHLLLLKGGALPTKQPLPQRTNRHISQELGNSLYVFCAPSG